MISCWAANDGACRLEPRVRPRVVLERRDYLKRRLTDRPLAPAHPEAGVFAYGLGHWPSRCVWFSSLMIGQRTCGTCRSVIGRGRVQWPREERERLPRRPAGGGLRVEGRTGSGKNVPSGNSRYRLNTWTCPSLPRLPSITNLVPTGNRLGRRLKLDAMTTSCNTVTLPLQRVGQLVGCMS